MADVESLELQITGDARSAEQSIDSLIQTLGRLKSAAQGGSGLRAIANPLQKISTAVNSISGAGQKLKDLAGGLTALSKASNFKISSNIANQITAINNAIKSSPTDYSSITNLFAAVQPLATLSKGGLGTLIGQIKKLPEAVEALDNVDLDSFGSKVEELANKLRPLADEMSKVASGFTTFPGKIQKFLSYESKIPSSNKTVSTSFVNLASKAAAFVYTLKRVGGAVAQWINESNEYVENLNLFTVAMGEYAGEAQKYAEQVGEAMGIDPAEWMRSQGVFMLLGTGFGVAGDRAAKMSQQLTQLGYDLSSIYNMPVEEAMQKLKSGFAGELEPLRSLGYDLSQAKLEAIALSLGIDKSVSSMTQAEKAELRYYAIMTQLTEAHGDMARTLDDPANQLRVLRAQLNQAARALGDLFIPMLKAVLPYLIAATKVVRILANAIGGLFGAKSEVGESGLGNLGSCASDASDAIGEAANNAAKLRKTLLGIDELNVLSDASGTGTGSDGSGSEFEFELPTMENWLNTEVGKQIDEIVEKMKKWLGITEDIDTWSELMNTRFGSILTLVGLIGAGMVAWKVTKGTLDAIAAIKALLASPTYSIAIGVILTITGVTIAFEGLQDAVARGLDGFNFGEIIGGSLLTVGGSALLGTKLASWITTAFAGSKVATALTTAAVKLFGTTTGPITAGAVSAAGGVLAAAVSGIILGIPTYLVGIYDAIKNGIDWLSAALIPVGATAAGAGIGTIIGAAVGSVGGPAGAAFGALAGLVVGLATDLVILIVQNWEEIVAWCSDACKAIGRFFTGLWVGIVSVWNTVATWFDINVIRPVVGFFSGLWVSVSGFFTNLWTGIVVIWSTVATWFDTNVVQPLVSFFVGLWGGISTAASNCWTAIVSFFTPAFEWFSELFGSIWQTLSDIFYNIGVIASGCWEVIKVVWGMVGTWFDTNIIQPLGNFFTKLWADIRTAAIGAWDGIKSVFGAISNWIHQNIIQPVGAFFSNLWECVKAAAIAAWDGIKSVYSGIMGWIDMNIIRPVGNFFTNLWTGFVDGARSAWESVKTIFGNVSSFFKDTFQKAWQGIVNVFSVAGEIFVDIKDGILTAFKKVVNGLISGLNSAIAVPFNGINTALRTIKNIEIVGIKPFSGLKEISVPKIPKLAEGGVINGGGQLFVANEAGPELVANVGRKTAVMNNDQIVDSVSQGVYRAVVQAMGQSGGNQVVEAKVNDKVLFEVVVNRNRQETMRTGYSPLLGGA